MVGRIFLQRSRINEMVLAFLKTRYPSELEVDTSSAYPTLIVKDRVTIKFSDIVDALKIIYPEAQAERLARYFWGSWLLNKQNIIIEEIAEDHVVLNPTETKLFTMKLNGELYEKVKKYAEKQGKSVAEIVREHLRKLVESET